MKTKSKQTKVSKQWVLKNKETGKIYSNWTYPSRNAARKAAKGRRFKGAYVAVKSGVEAPRSGDGGIDPKKLKKSKPSPTPKSEDVNGVMSFQSFMDWLFQYEENDTPISEPIKVTTESTINTMSTQRKNVNTKPKLRKSSSAPGAKFHRTGTFGVK